MNRFRTEIPDGLAGCRLDQALAQLVPQLSRRTSRIALEIGCVFLDGKRIKVASRKVRPGQTLDAHLGGAFERALSEGPNETPPELPVLFEDESLVVVDKPARMLSAPTPESDRGNLKYFLERTRPELFVVHRLDLQTSGVMLFAKTARANRVLAETFRKHDLERRYSVFVRGSYPVERETLNYPLSGKACTTHVEVIERNAEFSRLKATLETGRTHQIRKHLTRRGYPVLADPRYGRSSDSSRRSSDAPPRLALHAEHLGLRHPEADRRMVFEAPLADDLARWLAQRRPPRAQQPPPPET